MNSIRSSHATAGDTGAHLACCAVGVGGVVLFSSATASAAAMPLRMAPSALELRQKSPQAARRRPGSVKQGSPCESALKALAQRCARRYVGSGLPSAQQERPLMRSCACTMTLRITPSVACALTLY